MSKEELKQQILKAVEMYVNGEKGDFDPAASMLSGMSLVATFLAKKEGDKTVTPQFVASAVCEVAKSLGYQIERMT